MSKTNFGQFVKYSLFKFQNYITRHFKIVATILAVLILGLFFIPAISHHVSPFYTHPVSSLYSLRYIIYHSTDKYFAMYWSRYPYFVAYLQLIILSLVSIILVLINLPCAYFKRNSLLVKIIPIISMIINLTGVITSFIIIKKTFSCNFSWAFYILILMIVFYATYFGLYLYFRNRPAPEKPVRTPKPTKEKPLTDKERIEQLEREVEELKKRSNDNPPPDES